MAEYVKLTVNNSEHQGDDYYVKLTLANADVDAEYRARTFFYFSGMNGYSGKAGYGLFGEPGDGSYVRYDDWDSSFRPPRSDADAFNNEVIVGFVGGVAELTLSGKTEKGETVPLDDTLSGHSAGDTVTQFLVEKLDHSVPILSVSSAGGIVTVVTEGPHAFDDGDAISIYGIPEGDTSDHLMGVSGERYMGTFRVSVNPATPNRFTYTTGHYSNPAAPYSALASATASKWTPCTYAFQNATIEPGDDDVSVEVSGLGRSVRKGDYVMLTDYNGSPILDVCVAVKQVVTDDKVVLDCPPSVGTGSGYGIRFCGSAPSRAIPVNWPAYALAILENSTVYDHTVNTVKVVPTRDSAFSATGGTARGKDTELEVSSSSVAVFGFTPPLALATDDAGAVLNLFVTGMTSSQGTLVIYQMKSSGWEYSMPLDTVKGLISDVPIASADIRNPGLDGGPDTYISVQIPGSAIRRWMTESNRYPMDFAVMYVGTGKAYVLSSESEHPPYMDISGGAKAVEDPELFAIAPQVPHAAPGSLVRFTVQDGAEIDDSVFSDTFWFVSQRGERPETEAFIVSGSNKYIDVIVPDGLNGDYVAVLRGKRADGSEIDLTDDTCRFYVDGNPQMRVVKLADKIAPGTIGSNKVGIRGIYTRDFAFDGFVDITDGNSLIQNVYSILLTRRGERLFMPSFGTNLEDKIFDLLMDGEEDDILAECIGELREHEPRVEVSMPDSSVVVDEGGNGMVITLGLIMPTGVRQVIRLPFKQRGTGWRG